MRAGGGQRRGWAPRSDIGFVSRVRASVGGAVDRRSEGQQRVVGALDARRERWSGRRPCPRRRPGRGAPRSASTCRRGSSCATPARRAADRRSDRRPGPARRSAPSAPVPAPRAGASPRRGTAAATARLPSVTVRRRPSSTSSGSGRPADGPRRRPGSRRAGRGSPPRRSCGSAGGGQPRIPARCGGGGPRRPAAAAGWAPARVAPLRGGHRDELLRRAGRERGQVRAPPTSRARRRAARTRSPARGLPHAGPTADPGRRAPGAVGQPHDHVDPVALQVLGHGQPGHRRGSPRSAR